MNKSDRKFITDTINSLIGYVDNHFETIDKRFDSLIKYMDNRFDALEEKFDNRCDSLEARVSNLENSTDYLISKVDDMSVNLDAVILQQENHENRLQKLELATN